MFKNSHPRPAATFAAASLILCAAIGFGQAPPAVPPVPPATQPALPPQPALPKPPPLGPPGGGRPVVTGQPGLVFQPAPGAAPTVLSRNYSLKLTLKNGDTAETVEILTASPRISFSAALGKTPAMMVNLSGNLQELEGGRLVFDFSVGGRVPEIVESAVTTTTGGGGPNVARNIQYSDETSLGAVHIKPGADHTLFASGARAYILRITPIENDK